MRAVFALVAWLVLAGLAVTWTGYRGLLGVGAVCLVYYALVRPRVRRQEESRRYPAALTVANLSNYRLPVKAGPRHTENPRQ